MKFSTVATAIDGRRARKDPGICENWPWFCEWLQIYDTMSGFSEEQRMLFASEMPNDLVVSALAYCEKPFFVHDDVLWCTLDVPSNRRIPAADVFLRYGSDAFYSAYERGVFFLDPAARQKHDPNWSAERCQG